MSAKVLIIDDDPMVRALVKEMLCAEGYDVTMAEDGTQGLNLLTAGGEKPAFAAVVLDVIMPGMNGFDVLSQLRQNPNTKKLPVLMLTGEDRAEDMMTGYSVGADYYITKPFTRDQLMLGFKLIAPGF